MKKDRQIDIQKQKADKSLSWKVRILLEWSPVLISLILGLVALLAFSIRIFSVIRYESIIHEFDPWFNFRATKYLTSEGIYKFWNWFDSESWYPLGRSIGGTIYPGIMFTSAFIHWIAKVLLMPIDIRNVCVFMSPTFAGLTSISTFFLTKEMTNHSGPGLLAALMIAIIPSYISRSVAGSFDNECVAICALVTTFLFWIKAVNKGSITYSILCALSYFYMVSAWGGYSFIINIIPLFSIGTLFLGRYSFNVYIAYSVFYVIGTLLSFNVPFVGFLAVMSAEHLCSHSVFLILQVHQLLIHVEKHIPKDLYERVQKKVIYGSVIAVGALFIVLTIFGFTKWGGRSMTLFDPTYASKNIPIIASVSEHQSTTWTSYFFDLNFVLFMVPVGFYACCRNPSYGKIFAGLYGILAIYFSCVMIRLMLVLAPAACILGGIGYSYALRKISNSLISRTNTKGVLKKALPVEIGLAFALAMIMGIALYVSHSTYVASEAYSYPSVILSSGRGTSKVIIDDYREAYYWLRMNTREDAKIMSWWDYGYQITGFANRTTLVDNNTWNYTHIATVGRAMSGTETEAHMISRMLDVDYVLVIFGGMAFYNSDDISKFLWMVRIGAGVFPQINEQDYYNHGSYRTDAGVTDTMKNCLMYKLCYYRTWETSPSPRNYPNGYDSARKYEIGYKNYKINLFTEAFTSERWIVRIYKVNKLPNINPSKELKKISEYNSENTFFTKSLSSSVY